MYGKMSKSSSTATRASFFSRSDGVRSTSAGWAEREHVPGGVVVQETSHDSDIEWRCRSDRVVEFSRISHPEIIGRTRGKRHGELQFSEDDADNVGYFY